MRSFYATKISPNLSRTDRENYLIAAACNVARTGIQRYRADEIGLEGNDLIDVYRSPEEVFSTDTLASLNGKCITELHPAQFLSSQNTTELQRGFCINPRRGGRTEDGDDLLIADLVITDEATIQKVLGGLMRELSIGYECQYGQDSNGRWVQRSIICNHLALVPEGRAGNEVRIRDHALELQDLAVAVTDSNAIRTQPEIRVETPATQPKEKPRAMASSATAKSNPITRFFVQAFSARMKDGADPEELEKAAADYAALATERAEKQAGDSAEEEAEKKKQADRKAKDAAEEEEKKLFKEKEKEEADKKAKDAAAAEEKAAADKKVKDEAEEEERKKKESEDAKRAKDAAGDGTELHPELKKMCDHVVHMRDCMDSLIDHMGVEKKAAESKDEGLIPMVVEPEADRTKNPIPGADSMQSVRDYLNNERREVAQSNDLARKDKWNKAWIAAGGSEATRSADSARGGKDDGYSAILNAGMPEHTRRAKQFTGDSMIDNEKRMDEAVKRAGDGFDAVRKKLQGGVN